MYRARSFLFFFFFNDTATTEIYTLSLHDALPIYVPGGGGEAGCGLEENLWHTAERHPQDRKSTRLNSSHPSISYAVFCLKKKKKKIDLVAYSKKPSHKHKKEHSKFLPALAFNPRH